MQWVNSRLLTHLAKFLALFGSSLPSGILSTRHRSETTCWFPRLYRTCVCVCVCVSIVHMGIKACISDLYNGQL